jgi:hypothetical protein
MDQKKFDFDPINLSPKERFDLFTDILAKEIVRQSLLSPGFIPKDLTINIKELDKD